MDLRHIRYFMALYEEQSVTKAAASLHVVQPAVSTQIRNLEAEFGVHLFERTPSGVFPTAVARALYPLCARIVEDLAAAHRALRDASGTVTGSLTIGVPPSMAQGVLADYLLAFNDRFPGIAIRCYEGYSRNLVDWLRHGVLDFAIVNTAVNDPRVKSRLLWTEHLVVAYAAGSAQPRGGGGMPAAALRDFKLVLPTKGNYLRTLMDTEIERFGIAIEPALELDSLATVLQLVHSQGWATILPEMATWGSSARELVAARLTEPTIERSLLIAYQPAKEPSLAAQKFIDGIDSALRQRQAVGKLSP